MFRDLPLGVVLQLCALAQGVDCGGATALWIIFVAGGAPQCIDRGRQMVLIVVGVGGCVAKRINNFDAIAVGVIFVAGAVAVVVGVLGSLIVGIVFKQLTKSERVGLLDQPAFIIVGVDNGVAVGILDSRRAIGIVVNKTIDEVVADTLE